MASLVLGLASVVISVIALTVTAVLAGKQAHISDMEHIRTYLTIGTSEPCRIAELPEKTRRRFRRVTDYFDQ